MTCAHSEDNDPRFLLADSKDSDQTGRTFENVHSIDKYTTYRNKVSEPPSLKVYF